MHCANRAQNSLLAVDMLYQDVKLSVTTTCMAVTLHFILPIQYGRWIAAIDSGVHTKSCT